VRQLLDNPCPRILEIDQRTPADARACDDFIRDPLAQFVSILVGRDFLADVLERGRHVRNGALIELGQPHCLH